MQTKATILKTEDRNAVMCRKQSFISGLYRKETLLQLSQEAVVSVQVDRTVYKRFSTTLKEEDVQTPVQRNMLNSKDRSRGLIARSDVHVVLLTE